MNNVMLLDFECIEFAGNLELRLPILIRRLFCWLNPTDNHKAVCTIYHKRVHVSNEFYSKFHFD